MKKCKNCNLEKKITDFYKHSKMKDGHLNICIECKKKSSNIYYNEKSKDEKWMESERKRALEKYSRLDYYNKYIKKYKLKFPEKKSATNASQRIERILNNTQNHHWSYNEKDWKDVIELSVSDHNRLHNNMNYDPVLKLYRNLNGELLSTKQSHIDLLLEIKNNK